MKTTHFIQELINLYGKLIIANESFAESKIDLEKFQFLIDQRALVFEDLKVLETEVVNYYQREVNLKTEEKLPLKILKAAVEAEGNSEVIGLFAQLIAKLESLILSDKAVDEYLSQQKAEVKAELNKVRRGKAIKGYAQAGPVGSCFINKIK